MRITFVISDANLTGGVRAVGIFAHGLKALGHEVTVVSRRRPAPRFRQRVKSLLTGKGWPGRPNGKTHLDEADYHHHIIDQWRPLTDDDIPDGDVVIATWWQTAEWVARLSPAKGAKVYFVQHHEVVFNNQPRERVAATYYLPLHKICCAKWLKDLMRDEYGDPAAEHIPYGVDHELFNARPRSKQPVPTVGVMYSRAVFKGCDISLKAVELAAKRLPNLRLLAFGIPQPSDDLPLPANTTFFHQPPQTQIRDVYAACDAWLFASRCEGYGLPLLEAMACRTPVIATPTGAGPELLEGGGGYMINHEDPAGMADAIERICKLPDEQWRELSDKACNTAQRYHWDESVRHFESALQRVCAQDSGRNAPALIQRAKAG